MTPARISAGGQRFENGAQPVDWLVIAANHQAVTLFETPDAAADAHVYKGNAPFLQRGGAAHTIFVIAITTVNNRVAGVENAG